jgi:serine/threonine protein phosphatase PrpC
LQIEHAELSLIGDRDDNQDRMAVIAKERATLLMVIDGMGGHSDGARAADTALKSLSGAFERATHPIFDPLGFLHVSLSRAHDDVVRLGALQNIDARPRATIAICLVQEGAAYWAHVGDSRVYHLRHRRVVERTRDHSHVEFLLKERKIVEADTRNHPMRNFVESCLGGDASVPEMSLSGRKSLIKGDLLLLCTDGIWANLGDADIAEAFAREGKSLESCLQDLGGRAVTAAAPHSDNSTAAVLRWLGD